MSKITKIEEVKITLPKAVFGVKVSPKLLATAVRVHLGNRRAANAKTKTRGQVEGSTRKIYRQKGTGRARHGAIRAPIFVGGGIAFGPTGEQNYKLELPAKMRRLATVGALSTKAAKKAVKVISGVENASGKTAEVAGMFAPRTLVVSTLAAVKFNRACRNLERVEIIYADHLNAYKILAYKQLVLTQPALKELVKKYGSVATEN